MKKTWKKLLTLVMAVLLAVSATPISAKAEPQRNASDLAELQKFISQQKALGVNVSDDITQWTEWNPDANGYRLASIYIEGAKGNISLAGFPELTVFECPNGSVTSLNVSKNSKLYMLNCSNNNLSSLNVTHNKSLSWINCSGNKLKSLNVTKCPILMRLDCSKNNLTSLNVTKSKDLTNLNCSNNKLKKLNLTKCKKLSELDCSNNNLIGLNVTKNKELSSLKCKSNKITRLNVKGSPYVTISCDKSVKVIGQEDDF